MEPDGKGWMAEFDKPIKEAETTCRIEEGGGVGGGEEPLFEYEINVASYQSFFKGLRTPRFFFILLIFSYFFLFLLNSS